MCLATDELNTAGDTCSVPWKQRTQHLIANPDTYRNSDGTLNEKGSENLCRYSVCTFMGGGLSCQATRSLVVYLSDKCYLTLSMLERACWISIEDRPTLCLSLRKKGSETVPLGPYLAVLNFMNLVHSSEEFEFYPIIPARIRFCFFYPETASPVKHFFLVGMNTVLPSACNGN